ncbi:hypothetical protein BJY00DRAFT_171264 [Aspergillus carlsbadensis]|nr:hypothetical protein BJY00DRAFT_171264 [Aspergillus carlsbadensis]
MEGGVTHRHEFESRKFELQALLHNPAYRDDLPNIRAALEYYWEHPKPHDEKGCIMFYNGKRIHVLDSASLRFPGRLWTERFSYRDLPSRPNVETAAKLMTLREVEVLTVKMEPSHPCGSRRPPSDGLSEPMVTPDSAATASSSVESSPSMPPLLEGEEIQRRDENPCASSSTRNGCKVGPATLPAPEEPTPANRFALPPQNSATGSQSSQIPLDPRDRWMETQNARKKLACHDRMSTDTTKEVTRRGADKLIDRYSPHAEAAESITCPGIPAKGRESKPIKSRSKIQFPAWKYHRRPLTRDWARDRLDNGSNPALARVDGFASAPAVPPSPVIPGPGGPPAHLQSNPPVPLELDARDAGGIARALDQLEQKLMLLEARLNARA